MVKSAQVFTSYQETGVAVMTKSNRMFVVNNIIDAPSRKYSARKYSELPNYQGL